MSVDHNPAWDWNDTSDALGQDFASDDLLLLARAKIANAIMMRLGIQYYPLTPGRAVTAPPVPSQTAEGDYDNSPYTLNLPSGIGTLLQWTNEGSWAASWPCLQLMVYTIARDLYFADASNPNPDIATLFVGSGSTWKPTPLWDGISAWPGPNGFTRKAPRQIRSMDATYVSGPTVYTASSVQFFTGDPYFDGYAFNRTDGGGATGTPLYATPAKEGDVARFTIEKQSQMALTEPPNPANLSSATLLVPIPALPATPTADYAKAPGYFQFTGGTWIPYTKPDAAQQAVVTDFGRMQVGDYLGTWIVAELVAAINQLTWVAVPGLTYTLDDDANSSQARVLTQLALLNPNSNVSPGSASKYAAYNTALDGGQQYSATFDPALSNVPMPGYCREIRWYATASIPTEVDPSLEFDTTFFSSPNTMTEISRVTSGCINPVGPTFGSLTPPRPGTGYEIAYLTAIVMFDACGGWPYVANPCGASPGCMSGDCPKDGTGTGTGTGSVTGSGTGSSGTGAGTGTGTGSGTGGTGTGTAVGSGSGSGTGSGTGTGTGTAGGSGSGSGAGGGTGGSGTGGTGTGTGTGVTGPGGPGGGGCVAVDTGASNIAHCFALGQCGTWTAPGNGTLRLVYNDVAGQYADNTGSFAVTWAGTSLAVAGTNESGVSVNVTAATTYTYSATGTVANAAPGNAHYYSTGPNGSGSPGHGTTCDAASYGALIGMFTPAAAGAACDQCTDGRSDYAVGDSALTTRCLIYSFTCIDIGVSTSGQSGSFTDSAGAVFAWSDTGDVAATSYTNSGPNGGGTHTPPTSVCNGTGNLITITRTA